MSGIRMSVARVVAACVAVLAWSAVAHAQSQTPCPDGLPHSADLGIRQLDGSYNIDFRRLSSDPLVIRRVWRFYEEPRVGAVDPSGPSFGKLKDGDVLVAIDDALITTSEAGRKIGNLDPTRTVRLTVRRDGKKREVTVKPRSRCPDDELAQAYQLARRVRTPRAPRAPRAPEPPQAPRAARPEWTPAPMVTPMVIPKRLAASGWFGVGLDCGECGWKMLRDSTAWLSNEPLTIYYVDPESPADKGGLQRGDVLTEIDGVSLLTERGGLMFGGVKPGQSVKWTLRRDGETKNVTVVAGARPGSENVIRLEDLRNQIEKIPVQEIDEAELRRQMTQVQKALEATRVRTPSAAQKLRWSGSVGNADVTVQGHSHVQITTDEETGELVIRTADATIRVKKSDLEKASKGKK